MNKTSIGQKMESSLCSGNGDMYSGIGNMWDLARRHNQQSVITNGAVTCRKSRKVTKTSQLPLV